MHLTGIEPTFHPSEGCVISIKLQVQHKNYNVKCFIFQCFYRNIQYKLKGVDRNAGLLLLIYV